LKFNRPFEKYGRRGERAMRLKSMLKRLFDKIVQAGLASVLGGLLLTYFPLDRMTQPTTVKVTQASPEMMQLLRDEHGLMLDFAKEQVASEKSRGAADPSGQSDAAEASAGPAAQVTPPQPRPMPVVALAAPKAAAPRSKPPVTSASIPSAALSQPPVPASQPAPAPASQPAPAPASQPAPAPASQPVPAPASQAAPQPAPQPAARTDDSLLAKTIGIKDQVVSATQRAVSATIGVIPTWFGSLGDRIGGDGQSPRPPANLVSASWTVPGAIAQ
jgi:hypothetical protein